MTSDFPGSPRPDDPGRDQGTDLGPAEPGLARLITTLTSGPVGNELAGEQAALSMFRANFGSPAPSPAATQPLQTEPSPQRPHRTARSWRPAFSRIQVVTISAAAVIGGFAGAAYAQALPAPVQHIAYEAFHALGVPDSHRAKSPRGSAGATPGSAGHTGGPHAGRGHSAPPSGVHSSASPATSTKPGSTTSPAGPVSVSAQAAAATVPAGTPATISVSVTAGGAADAGLAVTLHQHSAGTPGWQAVAHGTTNSQGQVSFTTGDLGTNSGFRISDGKGDVSGVVVVKVVPTISVSLTYGARGVKDYLAVSAQFTQAGNVVALQEMEGGSWVTLRTRRLSSAGATTFTISATNQDGNTLRVVLLPTRLHAAAASNSVTVGPPK
jgi:hypothetical protein